MTVLFRVLCFSAIGLLRVEVERFIAQFDATSSRPHQHPTVKPVALVADAILDCSKRRGIVLDVFAGSGTTLVAAERMGRCGYGIELDAAYCDTILKRVSGVAGVEARLLATGQTFAEVAAERVCEVALPHGAPLEASS